MIKVKCPTCGFECEIDAKAKLKRWSFSMEEWAERSHPDCQLVGTVSEIEKALKEGKLVRVS